MTALPTFVIVALVAAAAGVVVSDSPDRRLPRVLPSGSPSAPEKAQRPVLMHLSAAVAGAGLLAVVGGPTGVVLALLVIVMGPRLLARLESRGDRERREAAERQAPLVADLLASTLAAGVPIAASLRAVAQAVGEPSAAALRTVVSALELGADAEQAWRGCAAELSAVAQAAARSARTGAPLAMLLRRISDDLGRDRRRAVEVAARSAGVRAVAPLAACFLPAFLLVGVVPVVASLASGLLSSGQ